MLANRWEELEKTKQDKPSLEEAPVALPLRDSLVQDLSSNVDLNANSARIEELKPSLADAPDESTLQDSLMQGLSSNVDLNAISTRFGEIEPSLEDFDQSGKIELKSEEKEIPANEQETVNLTSNSETPEDSVQQENVGKDVVSSDDSLEDAVQKEESENPLIEQKLTEEREISTGSPQLKKDEPPSENHQGEVVPELKSVETRELSSHPNSESRHGRNALIASVFLICAVMAARRMNLYGALTQASRAELLTRWALIGMVAGGALLCVKNARAIPQG